MSLVKIKTNRVTDVFISEEPIGNLCVVCISDTGRKVKLSTSATQELVAGVNVMGAALSGQPVRVVTHGEVSGLICDAAVTAGDRLAGTTSGRVTPLNTITPAGTISRVSGLISVVTGDISRVSGSILLTSGSMVNVSGNVSGFVGVQGQALINPGGLISGVTGFLGEIPVFTGAAPVFSGAVPILTGTAFNTQRILGKALDTGGIGSGIRVLVALGG